MSKYEVYFKENPNPIVIECDNYVMYLEKGFITFDKNDENIVVVNFNELLFFKEVTEDIPDTKQIKKYKEAFDIISNSTSCNNCGKHKCRYKKIGDKVVYNCPHYMRPFGYIGFSSSFLDL